MNGFRLSPEQPWPGLGSYDESAASFYFGRDAEIDELLRLTQLSPLTVLYGKSGLGKTSLLNAGLFPALRQRGFLPIYIRLEFRALPSRDELGTQVLRRLREEINRLELVAPAAEARESLWSLLHRRDFEVLRWDDTPLVPIFVFDQFEEVFTLGGRDPTQLAELRDLMASLIENRLPRLGEQLDLDDPRIEPARMPYKVLLSFREDYLPELETWTSEVPSLLRRRLRLLAMNQQQAMHAVAQAGAMVVDLNAVPSIIRFVADQEAQSPVWGTRGEATVEPVLLSLCCFELNRRRGGQRIDEALLQAAGGNILEDFYWDALVDMPPSVAHFIEDQLIQGQRYRTSYPVDEALLTGMLTEAQLRELTDRHRLLRIDQQLGVDRIELIHDRLVSVVFQQREIRKQQMQQQAAQREALLERQKLEALNALANELSEAKRQAEALVAAAADRAYGRAVDALERDEIPMALALLAEVLTFDPGHGRARRQANAILLTSKPVAPFGTPLHHDAAVTCANFSQDGRLVVTACNDGFARLWDTESACLVGRPLPHPWIHWAYFGHSSLLTVGKDWSARLWRVVDGKVHEVSRVLADVWYACFDPEGHRILTIHADNSVRLVEAQTKVHIVHGGPLNGASFSDDGRRIVTVGADQKTRVWDATTGSPLGTAMRHPDAVRAAAFSPCGKLLLTGGDDGKGRIWSAETGEACGPVLDDQNAITATAFSPDGQRVLMVYANRCVRLWNPHDGKPVGEPMRHDEWINLARFSIDGRRVVTVSNDCTARIWDTRTARPIVAPLRHAKPVIAAACSPDGRRLVTASKDGTARIWSMAVSAPVGRPLRHDGPVHAFDISPDGSWIISAGLKSGLRAWDFETGTVLTNAIQQPGAFFDVDINNDSNKVVAACDDNTARIWEWPGGNVLDPALKHGNWVRTTQFSPDGSLVATASRDHTAQLWETSSGLPVMPAMQHEDWVRSARFSSCGRFVVTASRDMTARFWDAHTAAPIGPVLTHKCWVQDACFSPDGEIVLTCGVDRIARLWDFKTGALRSADMRHGDWVLSGSFSADGERIVTASADNTVRAWDASGSALGCPMRHDHWAVRADFTADGRHIVSASTDRTVRIWDAQLDEPFTASDLVALAGIEINAQGRSRELDVLERDGWLQDYLAGSRRNRLIDWYLRLSWSRTVSPYATVDVSRHIETEIVWALLNPRAEHDGIRLAPLILQSVYDLDPGHPLILLALALFEHEQTDTTRAALFTRLSIQRLPRDASLAAQMADLFVWLQDRTHARICAQIALELQADHPQALAVMAWVEKPDRPLGKTSHRDKPMGWL